MKKFNLLIISVILAIITVVLSWSNIKSLKFNLLNDSSPYNLEDTIDIFESLDYLMTINKETQDQNKTTSKYKNMTIVSKSVCFLDEEIEYKQDGEQMQKFYQNETLTIRLTEDGILYSVNMYLITKAIAESSSVHQYYAVTVEADYDIYITEDGTYVKFNKYFLTYYNNNDNKAPKRVMDIVDIYSQIEDKWIKCNDKSNEFLKLVSNYNNELFNMIKTSLIDHKEKKNVFKKYLDEYHLNSEEHIELFKEYFGYYCSLNLTLDTNSIDIDIYMEDKEKLGDVIDPFYEEDYKLFYEEDNIKIIDVGNTHISKINVTNALDEELLKEIMKGME